MDINQIKILENLISMMDVITIGLDFDGTLVYFRYPMVGKDLPNCVETLRKWQKNCKVRYILTTMRDGEELQDAIDWFADKGIELFGIQKHPNQETWTESPKCHCQLSIDDRNFGQPLKVDETNFVYVDWVETDKILTPIFEKYLKKNAT